MKDVINQWYLNLNLKNAPEKAVIVIHGCAHNPTYVLVFHVFYAEF